MKKLIAICCCILFATCIHAQSGKIGNETLTLQVNNGTVSLKSKKLTSLIVKSISIPGKMLKLSSSSTQTPIWGKGKQLQAIYDNGRKVSFTLYPSNPFVYIHTTIINSSKEDIELSKMEFTSVEMSIGKSNQELNTLGTGGTQPITKAQGSYTYSMLADPKSRNAILVSWLTQRQGIGFFTPKNIDNSFILTAGLEFGHYLIKPNQERSTDTLLIGLFDDGRIGLEQYGDYLAKEYNVHLPQKPEAYCTWYHRDLNDSGASNENELTKNAEFASQYLAPFGLNVFQIDDHWQSSMIDGVTYKSNTKKAGLGNGPIKTFEESNFNFPSGMAKMAQTLKEKGFTPGIWFMPFSGDMYNSRFDKDIFAKDSVGNPYVAKLWSGTCIDATSPKGEAFLKERFKRIYDWGYRYFKIDGLHTGAPSENIYVNRSYDGKPIFGKAKLYNENMTFVECFRKGMSIIKKEAPDAFLLGCSATQNMSSFASAFGMVDAMRVGPDNDSAARGKWKSVTVGADFSGNLYFLNNRMWYNDPDPYYVRESNSLNKARWMVSWQAISGVMGTTSMQYSELPAERLDLIKRGLPTHHLNARPVDILESTKPQIWLVGNDRMHIIGLFNWSEKKSATISYDLGRMGLSNNKEYIMFDYWANKYLGSIKGRLSSVVDSASCQVLAVREKSNYPQIISTSRHITQGLVDIVSEKWNAKQMTLTGISRVVKDDVYELRIVASEGFEIKKALCNNIPMKITKEGNLIRASFIPQITGKIKWNILFK